jgi:hypothetical protein
LDNFIFIIILEKNKHYLMVKHDIVTVNKTRTYQNFSYFFMEEFFFIIVTFKKLILIIHILIKTNMIQVILKVELNHLYHPNIIIKMGLTLNNT